MSSQTYLQDLETDYQTYIYPYLGNFVIAAASYLLMDSLARAILFSIDGKSKLAIINGFYAATLIPIAQTFWMQSTSFSKKLKNSK